jgi:ADP-ribosyl-[dinitrogen reductase] hydrolase
MLVELAIADAYGAPFENAPASYIAEYNTVRGYAVQRGIQPGVYTDDAQMTLAIAEALVSGEPWAPRHLAARIVDVYHRDPHDGYAPRFQQLLDDVQDGDELLERLKPDSDKSGAAMRASPVGLLPSVGEVLDHTEVQARITHNTLAGVEAAQAAALAVHYCHFGLGPVADVARWIDSRLLTAGGAGGWAEPWEGKVGSKGWMSVRAALTALTATTSLTELLRACVAFTGDTDTVATIAVAAASRSAEYAQDLPDALMSGLENGRYGRDYLSELDTRLLT